MFPAFVVMGCADGPITLATVFLTIRACGRATVLAFSRCFCVVVAIEHTTLCAFTSAIVADYVAIVADSWGEF